MISIGVFPYPTPLHDPIDLVRFLLIPTRLFTYVAGNVLRGASRLGAMRIGLGIIVLIANGWLVAVFEAGSLGLAIPELAVTISFDTWAGITIWRLYRTRESDHAALLLL